MRVANFLTVLIALAAPGGTAWTGERQELRENSGKPAHRYACRRPEMGGS